MAERKRKGLPRNRPPAEQAKPPEEADQPLSEAEKRLVTEFQKRREARHRPPRVKLVHKPPKPVTIERPADEPRTAPLARLMAFGTTSNDFYSRTFLELLEAACRGTTSKPFEEGEVNGALAAMHGIAPRDEIEAMLAAQMIAVHSAAMRCLRQLKGSDTIQQQDSNGNIAIKLLRTYTTQMEALQRYRGKGEQKMTVEHVHVHAGGQAIVGEVNAAARGEGAPAKSEDQPHAKQIAHAPGETLPGDFAAIRQAMPGAGR